MPYAEVIEWTDDGIPYGRPEIVLLFKARHSHLDKNRADFADALPSLAAAQRRQLRDWLELVHPGHEWLAELS